MTETDNPWDERYAGPEYKYGAEPNAFLKTQASRILPKGRVLCLAEGEGRNGVYLAGLGHQVTAVDGSAVGLQKARRLAEHNGVKIETIHMDLKEFIIEPQAWDAIVCIFCHLPPDLRKQVHHACVEGLRPGGVFLLEAYRPAQLENKTGGPPTADLMMTLASLREELSGLTFDHAAECDHDFKEGQGHKGAGAVVQVVGLKG